MPLYEITCNHTINSNGVRMEKGTKFQVTIPWATNPLCSGPKFMDVAMTCCRAQTGIDFSGAPSLFRNGNFNVVRKA